MKKFVLLAAVAALAACSETADDTTATADTTAEAPMPAETMAATTAPGTYDVKMADGTAGWTTINADGTYVDTDAEGNEIRGTFANKDGKDCFDPEGDDPEECWTVSTAGADGSFTATGPDGTTVTVTPRAAATPAT